MLGFKLNHVSKRGHWRILCQLILYGRFYFLWNTKSRFEIDLDITLPADIQSSNGVGPSRSTTHNIKLDFVVVSFGSDGFEYSSVDQMLALKMCDDFHESYDQNTWIWSFIQCTYHEVRGGGHYYEAGGRGIFALTADLILCSVGEMSHPCNLSPRAHATKLVIKGRPQHLIVTSPRARQTLRIFLRRNLHSSRLCILIQGSIVFQ